jgi:sugar lactone lactonase YvrE
VKLAIRLKKMLASDCNLGEGLWVKRSRAAWVDINRDQLLICEGNTVRNYFTLNKPSIIYDIENNEVSIGTDRGLAKFNTQNKKEVLLSDVSSSHSVKEFRSNDGGFCGDHQLLGFMHRNDPVKNFGFVYLVKDESFYLLDDSLHIPNSFIEIEPSKILISDSLKGQIWLYQLDDTGNLVEKTLWAQLDKGIAPDGGCLVGDFVFVALWDGSSIAVFNKSGKLIKNLPLPVIRPTNCKYDAVRSQLWVTSASEGLSKEQLSRYPLSGNTFVYNLELGS